MLTPAKGGSLADCAFFAVLKSQAQNLSFPPLESRSACAHPSRKPPAWTAVAVN
jgi:hypothetical protein